MASDSAGVTPEALRAFVDRETERLAGRPPSLPFERAEYASRLRRLRSRMSADGIDVLIVTAPDAMCWLHGYSSRWYRTNSSTTLPPTQCTVVHVDHEPTFMIETNFHEELVRLTSCVGDFRGIPTTDLNHEASVDDFVRFLVGELSAEGWLGSTVGLERWSCVPNPVVAEAIEAALVARRCRVVDATSTLRSVRRLKSPAEIEVIERAQAACDAGLLELQRHVRPGMTELEAWNLFMAGQIAAGGEPAAIHETVAVGPPEPMLHCLSSRRAIEKGDYFHADACGAVEHYHARGTRPFFLGEPPAELLHLAQIIGGVFEVLVSTARVGMPFRDLHRVLCEYYTDAGVSADDFFAGGYELGISFPPDWVGEFCWSIHDDETDALIEPGLVTNIESCVFLAMVDTVVFEEPRARILSRVPRELLVIP